MYYDLYVILDIFSRYVVGWTVAAREDSNIATELMRHAMGVHGVPGVLHADRGTSMTSKPVAQLLVDLGVTRSHSRPRVSNDNPYSESQFKTVKYCPAFPETFGSLAGRPRLRAGVLQLLQPRAPPLRDRAAHPRVGPPRHGRPRPRSAPADPRRRLHRPPPPVRPPPTPTPETPHRGLDQPALTRSAHTKRINPPLSQPT